MIYISYLINLIHFQLYDIGLDGGDQESEGELMAETDELAYECAPRQKHPVLFDEPIALYVIIAINDCRNDEIIYLINIFLFFFKANRWYVACARITGPSSDCGSSGMCNVTSDEQ